MLVSFVQSSLLVGRDHVVRWAREVLEPARFRIADPLEGFESGHRAPRIDGLVCDLDGVIYRGDEPIPGAVAKVAELRERGVRVVFCTNNSRPTVTQYVAKLEGMGIPTDPSDMVTSAVVTGEALSGRGGRAMVVGGDGVVEAVIKAGYEVVPPPEHTGLDVVVIGWDLEYTFDKMKRATQAVRAGASLIATNDDASFPAPGGLWPGTGAIVASIETATGVAATVMGKPHEPMMSAVARRLEGAERIAVVGDRADTDLAGGRSRGWMTILVLTGVMTADDAAELEPPPDLVLASIAALDV